MKHVLVTGAAGLLGSAVVETLAAKAYHVYAMYRHAPVAMTGANVQPLACDLSHQAGLDVVPADVEAIVHCAASIPHNFHDIHELEALWDVNVRGTLRVLTWAQEHNVQQFIYCSSHAVYQHPLPYPVPETHPTYPADRATAYAISKLAAEVLVSSFKTSTVHVCSLRLPTLYGRQMRPAGVLAHFVRLASQGKPITITEHPDSLFDFLYAQDAAQAILQCLQHQPVQSVYNIGSGRGITLAELAAACQAQFDPALAAPITIQTTKSQATYQVLDINNARRDIGYQPVFDIQSGLSDMHLHDSHF